MDLRLKGLGYSVALLCFVLILTSFGLTDSARAGVIYVDGSKASSGNGLSWAEAVKSVQEAVDAALPEDEIWIKRGVYILFTEIAVSKNLALYGGFQGTEHSRDQRNFETYQTVIDGHSAVRCFSITAAAAIDGLTLRNGFAATDGGAIHITGYFSKSIINCRFINNSAGSRGGAIFNDGGSVPIRNSFFSGNTAGSGGAINSQSAATVTGSIFANNYTTSGGGGAIYCSSTATVKNSVFQLNRANSTGGAIAGPGTFINSTFVNNYAVSGSYQKLYGNSLYFAGTTGASVSNCIFWRDDDSLPLHPEIQKFGPGSLSVSYSIVYGGHAGTGNLDEAPIFKDSSNSDFHLVDGSPGVDDGNNDSPFLPEYDLDGKFRILDGDSDGEAVVDMGAYELGQYVILSSPNGGETWLESEDPHSIEWISGDAGSLVKIEVSADSGSSWAELIAGTENDGIHEWDVAPPASRFCRIRVSSISHPLINDESDADFTIDLDSEPDGMSDLWELDRFGTLGRDGSADWDKDGLNDRGEFENQTDPKSSDTDGDGMPDGYEVDHLAAGLDPLVDDRYDDADGDGFCNIREFLKGTHPGDRGSQPALAVIHVDAAYNGEIEDGSRLNPFNSIQEAVQFASSQSTEEIWVRQGTYALSSSITISKDVLLFAGFDGTESTRAQRDWLNHPTVVDGQDAVICFEIDGDVVLDGFTITNGKGAVTISSAASDPSYPFFQNCYFTANEADNGGAIATLFTYLTLTACTFENNHAQYRGGAIYNEVAVLYVNACLFVDNQAQEIGGAIYNDGSWGTTRCYITDSGFLSNTADWQGGAINSSSSSGFILNCKFLQNVAKSSNGGGAIYNGGSVFAIDGCDFISNSAGWGGGAINNSNSLSTIKNCLFEDNHADYFGGAIWNWQTNTAAGPVIVNSVFRNNSTDRSGGAISNAWSAATITNSTFVNNTALEKAGGVYNSGRTFKNESPVIWNSIFWNNSAAEFPEIANNNSSPAVKYCDVKGGYIGTGNINKDPLLDANNRLSANSPCIDAGNNLAPEIPVADKDGKHRIIDGDKNGSLRVDMGAYEYGSVFESDKDLDGDVDGGDLHKKMDGSLNVSLEAFAGEFGSSGVIN
jgi:predicted outer membrane repeat protein